MTDKENTFRFARLMTDEENIDNFFKFNIPLESQIARLDGKPYSCLEHQKRNETILVTLTDLGFKIIQDERIYKKYDKAFIASLLELRPRQTTTRPNT